MDVALDEIARIVVLAISSCVGVLAFFKLKEFLFTFGSRDNLRGSSGVHGGTGRHHSSIGDSGPSDFSGSGDT